MQSPQGSEGEDLRVGGGRMFTIYPTLRHFPDRKLSITDLKSVLAIVLETTQSHLNFYHTSV